MLFLNFREILKDESGQGTVEYILILASAVALVLLFKREILQVMEGLIRTVGGKIKDAVQEITSTAGG